MILREIFEMLIDFVKNPKYNNIIYNICSCFVIDLYTECG
jgi:hypothetical protein